MYLSRPQIAFFLALLAVSDQASARLIGVDWNGDVWSINERTGEGVLVGPSGAREMNSAAVDADHIVWSTAYNGRSSFGYLEPTQLVTIDAITGSAILGPVLDPPESDIRSLAFADDTQLFAIDLGDDGLVQYLSTVDTTSGHVERRFELDPYILTAQALATGVDGKLFAWATFLGLVVVDPLTGEVEDVNPSDGNPFASSGFFFPQSLELAMVPGSPNTLFAVLSEGGLTAFLYEIDTTSGTPSLIGSGPYRELRGLAFLPQCSDGFDNDGDGVIDLSDSDCSGPDDDVEGNIPPNCAQAYAEPARLWPPNHSFAEVTVEGVSDDNGDPTSISITAIFQDEPTDGAGRGNFSPDALGIGTDLVALRAERSGSDGRVYHVAFVATDARGGTCEGAVTVCVPHDKGHGARCIDGGAIYESTPSFGGVLPASCGLGFELVLLAPLMARLRRLRPHRE